MIEAVDVHTTGLGGDSHVRLDREGRLVIGPRRAVPLSLLASEHPAVVGELRLRVATPRTHRDEEIADFIVPGRQPGSRLAEAESEILDQLAHGPRSVAQVAGQARIGALARRRIEELERRGLVRRAGFHADRCPARVGPLRPVGRRSRPAGRDAPRRAGRYDGRVLLRGNRPPFLGQGCHRARVQGAGG